MKDELVLQRHLHFHTSVSNLKESGPGSSVPLQKQIIQKKKKNTRGVILFRGQILADSRGGTEKHGWVPISITQAFGCGSLL